MTRNDLMRHKTMLEAAARNQGLEVDFTVAEGASEQEIVRCESSIGVRLSPEHRATLREWDGCQIDIYARAPESGKKLYRGSFFVPGSEAVSAWTRTIRHNIAVQLKGSPEADAVNAMMSEVAIITFQNDFGVLVHCDDDANDTRVRLIDMEYAGSEFPLDVKTIASSPDEYLEKCLNHLTKTLKTEIYW